ncbi:LOW QUALITY PROTEIN: integrin beta-8 [Lampris incognitus]|uniref:LOW QUALITY PROTEIN: integrin beta-8 n=1 Tax=Lampris incognitus TaxID=2546036 RepID=UPI0024B5F42E|nr:LOW QUALITY PROTEIN: integrin beta-8 [Lampris incognitus]
MPRGSAPITPAALYCSCGLPSHVIFNNAPSPPLRSRSRSPFPFPPFATIPQQRQPPPDPLQPLRFLQGARMGNICIAPVFRSYALRGADGRDSVCASSSISSCTECLRHGPQCAWCFMEGFLEGAGIGQRCDLPLNLLRMGCGPEFIEHPEVKVEVNATLSSTQVSPRLITITLRPGAEASFIVAVSQLERYPVDLYYLVDVSASMQENLDQLNTVGVALSHRMKEHSSDLQLGFGSFVDKPVSPYINVHPSKISNPCSDYEIRCRPAHGFHHVLSMTSNITEFTRVVKRQRISGNMDTPEGGLDAMLQAAVCQREVGWRPEAKRLLLLMTDQPSHLALDSRLAGIVTPHDGLCHLDNNIYTGTTRMDHPSMGQLSEKLLENHIHAIFAVEKQQYQWYEELVKLIPGSCLWKVGFFQALNLMEMVVNAYKRLLSEVDLSVSVEDRAFSRFWLSVSPMCPDGSVAKDYGCSGVQPNQTVYFNITIGLRSCSADQEDDDVTVSVRPVGFNESTIVRVRSRCRCSCGPEGRCRDSSESQCRGSPDEPNQEQEPDRGQNMDSDRKLDSGSNRTHACRADGSDVDCSGRGVCECGVCACEQSRLGMVYGKYCEMDDFSCPYEEGLLCGGRGVCVSGECVCDEGWTGESCGCRIATAACRSANDELCSGHGSCVCGTCVCHDPKYSGTLCERCPTCRSTCQSHWKCVDCHLSHGLMHPEAGHCNHTCAPLVGYVDDVTGPVREMWSQCVYVRNSDSCRYRFQTSSEPGWTQLRISTHPECSSSGRLVGTFLSVCALTVLCGLVIMAVSRLLMQRRGWPQGGAAHDNNYHCTGKDLSYIPTSNEKTVTYRRDRPLDRPVEMHIQVHKMPLGDSWQC